MRFWSWFRYRPHLPSMLAYLQIMRPLHWTKNFVLFAGLIFSHHLFSTATSLKVGAAFFLFCLLSSSIYILNDFVDRERDRQHPLKRNRPFVTGRLNPGPALRYAFFLLAFSLGGAFLLEVHFGYVALGYAGLMLLYSFYLKKIVWLDVLTIAAGFLLRTIGGCVVIRVQISPWLLICTLALALLLVLAKRRHEILLLGNNAPLHRENLNAYHPAQLDLLLAIVSLLTCLGYLFYTLSPRTKKVLHTNDLIYTFPLVVTGLLRYLFLIYKKNQGGRPEILIFSDAWLTLTWMLWLILAIIILY